MRLVKLCFVLGVLGVLAVGTASAIPFQAPNSGYQGPVVIKFTSYDMGVVYEVPTQTEDGITALNGLASQLYPSANGHYYDTNGVRDDEVGYDASLREDGWGVLSVDKIYIPGHEFDGILWQQGDNNKEISVLFYGLVDNAIAPGAVLGQEIIQTQNGQFDVYENDINTFDASLGSDGRTAFDEYTGITGGTLILRGLTQPGVGLINGTGGPDEFQSIFTPDNTGAATGSGTFASYLELDDTTALLQRDYNQFNTDTKTPLLYDLTVQGSTVPNDAENGGPIGNWIVLNEDPFRGSVVVPEPITMLGIGLACTGLLGYLRRRRIA